MGLHNLPSIDPFNDIAPVMDTAGYRISLPGSVFDMSNEEKSVGYSREEESDDNDEYWEHPDNHKRGASDIFDKFDDEN